MSKRFLIAITAVITVIVLILFMGATTQLSSAQDSPQPDTVNVQKNRPPVIPQTLSFAGEKVPIERLDVRESLDRELITNMYWHSNTFLMFKRAYRFFPTIEPVLKELNVPDDFKYLALIESGLTNAVSPAGASGFWQFMKATGLKHGLIINDWVDERYNLDKASVAACKYIKNSYKRFGKWTLAAAAYNMGDGGLSSQIEKQGVKDYFDLYLNNETARYVFRILAVKTIFENPFAYGFVFEKSDLYPKVNTKALMVDSSIADLPQFALDNGANYKILKEYNPWLRKAELVNKSRDTFYIHFPTANQLLYETYFPKVDSLSNN